MRIGFSLYAGWQTTATILAICQWFKGDILTDSSVESAWAINLFWIAWPLYIAATFREEDPIFGAVWSWVLFAVISGTQSSENEKKGLAITAWIQVIPHTVFILGFGVFLYKKYGG